MSVCLFGAEELGNVAAYLTLDGQFTHPEDLERFAKELAAYSVGNAAAYNFRYSRYTEKASPVTAREIVAAAPHLTKVDAKGARSCIQLLSYNGPEGEGLTKFKGSKAYAEAMVSLLSRAYSKAMREAEAA